MQIQANGIRIEVDVQGPPDGEPLLLIMGLGMQLIAWPDDFVSLLVARGFRVIRFDNRDIGLSESFDHMGPAKLSNLSLLYAMHMPIASAYTIDDMAADANGVLDALGISSAHVCGASMGGMVAQALAAHHPQRVRSLTLMMTTSGARHLPQPSRIVQAALIKRPHRPEDIESVIDNLMEFVHLVGSPAYRTAPALLEQRLRRAYERSHRPYGVGRQLMAIAAHGDRSRLLQRIQAPTQVIHGVADRLMPVAAAHDLVAKIKGSQLDAIDGMGHDLPTQLHERFAAAIQRIASKG